MRVGISAEFMGVKLNGTATYSRNLLAGLAEAAPRHTFRAYLSTPDALPLVPTATNIEPRVVGPYNALVRLAGTLPLELLHRPVDLLHSQQWGPPLAPCPMVATIHDLGWETRSDIYPPLLRWRLSLLVRATARRAIRVITSSRHSAADLQRLYGVPTDKLHVIYPALDPCFRPVTDDAALARIRATYSLDSPYLLYLGSIEPKKGVDRLIEAYAALRTRHDLPHHLVIAGKPLWLSRDILALPSALGIERHVHFLGQVPQVDVPALYSGATAFAFPGSYEGFGYPAVEAMACGTPVIAASAFSLPEVVGDAALLVDPNIRRDFADALARLLTDAALPAELRQRGLRRAAEFRPAPLAAQVVAVYEDALAESQVRHRVTVAVPASQHVALRREEDRA